MDKSSHSSGDSTTTSSSITTATATATTTATGDQYLRHLNKLSHKITKAIIRRPSFDQIHQPPPPPPSQLANQQPPVYNIHKSDFRDVVQKLTGSPPVQHDRFNNPPPIQPPKPPSSRLQRIRPPPLAQISNRIPSPLAQISNRIPPLVDSAAPPNQRPPPASPLPPFPAVHAAAESPISAYMRYFQTSISTVDSESDPKRLLQNQHQTLPPPSTAASTSQPPFQMPASPLPFGCFPSPRSPYPLLSPSLLFSPSTMGQLGFHQFPVSPKLPVPSPRWKW